MALQYDIPLDQSESHNGFERYNYAPCNQTVDGFRFEYVRDFSDTPATAAQVEQRDAIRALLVGGALNDAGVAAGLASIAGDAGVTTIDDFIAQVATKLNA